MSISGRKTVSESVQTTIIGQGNICFASHKQASRVDAYVPSQYRQDTSLELFVLGPKQVRIHTNAIAMHYGGKEEIQEDIKNETEEKESIYEDG